MKLLVMEDEIRLADILSDWFQKKGFEVTVCHDGLSGYEKAQNENTEIQLENIRLDRLTKEYLTEIKKSDADPEASKWQLLYYLKKLKEKGIIRKGKLEFIEKNKESKKTLIVELGESEEEQLEKYIVEIEMLVQQKEVPPPINGKQCKKCAYYEYCYI